MVINASNYSGQFLSVYSSVYLVYARVNSRKKISKRLNKQKQVYATHTFTKHTRNTPSNGVKKSLFSNFRTVEVFFDRHRINLV